MPLASIRIRRQSAPCAFKTVGFNVIKLSAVLSAVTVDFHVIYLLRPWAISHGVLVLLKPVEIVCGGILNRLEPFSFPSRRENP